MDSVIQAQRSNYQNQLEANRKEATDLQQKMQANAAQFEQLRGALFALDQVAAAMAPPAAPPADTTAATPPPATDSTVSADTATATAPAAGAN